MSDNRRAISVPDIPGQGLGDAIVYEFDFEPMLKAIAVPETPVDAKVYVLATGEDVTGTVMTGAATLSGYLASTGIIQNLTRDVVYRIVIRPTVLSTQRFSAYKDIIGEL